GASPRGRTWATAACGSPGMSGRFRSARAPARFARGPSSSRSGAQAPPADEALRVATNRTGRSIPAPDGPPRDLSMIKLRVIAVAVACALAAPAFAQSVDPEAWLDLETRQKLRQGMHSGPVEEINGKPARPPLPPPYG